MNRTFKATVTLDKTRLAELIIWAVKNNCSGGLTFGADLDGDIVPAEVSITGEEARAAIDATADLPPRWPTALSQRMAQQQRRRAERDSRYVLNERGRVDIDASCRALGISREELLSHRWKAGSTEHRVKCAILKKADLQRRRRKRTKAPKPSSARPLVRTTSGAIDIEESILSLGLSRDTILRRKWKQGSNPHRLKAAIRCGWKEALKAKNAHAYRDSNGKRNRDMEPTYSTNGNLMGEAEMKEKGLKDTSMA